MSVDNDRDRLQGLIGADYRLIEPIGHGGMSTVWLAHNDTGAEIALKVLRPEFSDNTEFLRRFENEAHAAQAINSAHVVRTFDYRQLTAPSGHMLCFIAMEYVEGRSLADVLAEQGRVDEDTALDILEQAADGLAAIHVMGMVHRDMKPGNILITHDGVVKITDFGIAKAAAAVPLTRTGMVVGTAQYVSPEQAQGHEVDPASDVYSLGVVGYEMLAGKRPFTGDSSVSVAIAHISTPAPQLPAMITPNTRELIAIALRKDAARRFRDGSEFVQAVSTVRLGHRPPDLHGNDPDAAPGAAVAAPPAQPPAPPVQPDRIVAAPAPVSTPRRRGGVLWWALGAVTIASIIIVAVALIALMRINGSGDTTTPVRPTAPVSMPPHSTSSRPVSTVAVSPTTSATSVEKTTARDEQPTDDASPEGKTTVESATPQPVEPTTQRVTTTVTIAPTTAPSPSSSPMTSETPPAPRTTITPTSASLAPTRATTHKPTTTTAGTNSTVEQSRPTTSRQRKSPPSSVATAESVTPTATP